MIDYQGIGGVGTPITYRLRASLGPNPKPAVAPKWSVKLTVASRLSGTETSKAALPARNLQVAPRTGTPAPFLAQQISQEVLPLVPGIDQFSAASTAYVQARDINLVVLSQGPGLRIKI